MVPVYPNVKFMEAQLFVAGLEHQAEFSQTGDKEGKKEASRKVARCRTS